MNECNPEENYMDSFETPEEYIRHQILKNGHNSIITKKDMLKIIRENNIDFQITKPLAYIKKQVLLDVLLTKLSYKDLSKYVEVSRKSFCLKFGITEEEFKILEQVELIHKVIEHKRVSLADGGRSKWSQWSGYDVYDYYELTKETIDNALKNSTF